MVEKERVWLRGNYNKVQEKQAGARSNENKRKERIAEG